jgi:hypothetical protein
VIKYIQFIAEVSVGGVHNAISYWSQDKHGKEVHIEEKGSWVVLVLGSTNAEGEFTPSGQVRRVPITNVAYIGESRETKAGK